MYDSSITSKIPGLIDLMVMIFIFDCVILQTSHSDTRCLPTGLLIFQRDEFLKKLWCCVGGSITK